MNNEQQQIIDGAYENYSKAYEKDNSVGLTLLVQKVDGRSVYIKPDKEMFITMCTYDESFSKKCGLKIEETYDLVPHTQICADTIITRPVRKNKIIVTYEGKTIESYE